MTGWHEVEATFTDLADGDAAGAAVRLAAAAEVTNTALPGVMASVAHFWIGDFAAATHWGRLGLSRADGVDVQALACAAVSLAAGGDPTTQEGDVWAVGMALLDDAEDPGNRNWSAVRHLLTEAALVGARINDARRAAASGPAAGDAWAGHAFEPMMRVCDVRVAAFAGDIDRASELLGPMRASIGPTHRLASAIEAVSGLVQGNADDEDGLRRSIARSTSFTSASRRATRDFVDRGVLLLLAFGAVAVGDVTTAARLVFEAGDDGELGHSTIIDRALGLELFLVAALAEQDAAAVQTWLGALDSLAAHPIAAPTVQRCRGRVLLAAGEPEQAIDVLEASIRTCRELGRGVEATEGEIVLARARIATREVATAVRELRQLVTAADANGHRSVRRSAGVALHSAKRRLPPIAGAGWPALSAREKEVAEHLLLGRDIDEIAALLFLSPGTVRAHVSRVLCAFAVPTRIGLLATARRPDDSPPTPVPATLSTRQAEVAALIATGTANQDIAATLGISVKGVEKHVSDILARWQVGSRFGIARIWWAARE